MAKSFKGAKRRREIDKKRKKEEKRRRLQVRKDLRARGLDPDLFDDQGNPLPDPEDPTAIAAEPPANWDKEALEGAVFEISPDELEAGDSEEEDGDSEDEEGEPEESGAGDAERPSP